jgi:hypothetical protein
MTILAKTLFALVRCDLMALTFAAAGHWLDLQNCTSGISDFEYDQPERTPQIRVSLGHVLCADENG